jgi:hypothetical protein
MTNHPAATDGGAFPIPTRPALRLHLTPEDVHAFTVALRQAERDGEHQHRASLSEQLLARELLARQLDRALDAERASRAARGPAD